VAEQVDHNQSGQLINWDGLKSHGDKTKAGNMNQLKSLLIVMMTMLLGGCLGMPEGVEPVDNFELDRYLGKWYEIARLDHSFERGLAQVTAEYSLRDDGGVRVLNRGFSSSKDDWEEAEGTAFFVEDEHRAYLKVSFFGPFYGSYVVFELDREGYDYAFISGPDTSYLWLLARQSTVSDEVMERFRARALELKFDLEELILVNQVVQRDT
jgi:apolipoprotein D and lipocalin family protein